MVDSATVGLRERRMAETSARISEAARRLTAERGLHGFTVEEVCEEVGISRRTFFNYFPSKDEAIIGLAEDGLDEDAVARFLSSGEPDGRISADLLPALVELSLTRIRLLPVTPEKAGAFVAAIGREPALLQRMMRAGGEREKLLVALVEEREGLEAGDRRAELAVLLHDAMMRSSWARFIAPGNTRTVEALLLDALDAAAALLTPTDRMNEGTR